LKATAIFSAFCYPLKEYHLLAGLIKACYHENPFWMPASIHGARGKNGTAGENPSPVSSS
jgi:hypothetical protein